MKKKLMTLEQRRLLREAQQLLALSERRKRKENIGGVGIRRQHEYNGSPDETGYGFSDETL